MDAPIIGAPIPAPKIGSRAAAFHEAGHAVAAVILEIPFDRVSILADAESLGATIFSGVTPPSDWFHELPRDECDLIERRIVVALCGPEAERLSGERSDYQALASDWNLVSDLLKPLPLGAEGLSNYHNWLKERARAVIDGAFDRRAIEHVAVALAERHILTASQVAQVIGDRRKAVGL